MVRNPLPVLLLVLAAALAKRIRSVAGRVVDAMTTRSLPLAHSRNPVILNN
jgi:hypothetical protein